MYSFPLDNQYAPHLLDPAKDRGGGRNYGTKHAKESTNGNSNGDQLTAVTAY